MNDYCLVTTHRSRLGGLGPVPARGLTIVHKRACIDIYDSELSRCKSSGRRVGWDRLAAERREQLAA